MPKIITTWEVVYGKGDDIIHPPSGYEIVSASFAHFDSAGDAVLVCVWKKKEYGD